MWPIQFEQRQGRGVYSELDRLCKKIKQHRFGMVHLLPQDKTIQWRSCRRCGVREFSRFEVVDGEIRETCLRVVTDYVDDYNQFATNGTSIDGGTLPYAGSEQGNAKKEPGPDEPTK